MSTPRPSVTPIDSPAAEDVPAEDRVHHHARLDDSGEPEGNGSILTLCGLRLRGRRPEAAELPCCPMCALEMGRPCR